MQATLFVCELASHIQGTTMQFEQNKQLKPANTLLSMDNGHMYKFKEKRPYMYKGGVLRKHIRNKRIISNRDKAAIGDAILKGGNCNKR